MTDSGRMRRYLVGEPLNAVCFVLDYVELCFDGPIVRAFTGPIVRSGDDSVAFPDPGSRDSLCSMLGDVVTELEVDDDRQIALRFRSGKIIIIPVDFDSRAGPEAAHFAVPKDNVMEVW
jgi:hypothetical protein